MVHRHILLLTFPAQGHVNPTLQFAKRLMKMGVEVTFATSLFAYRRMNSTAGIPKGLNFAAFSDGYDDGFRIEADNPEHYMSEMRTRGSQNLKQIITSSADDGRPVTGLVYTLLLPWAAEVARGFNIPIALLWIQPATVLDIYYYYFYGYGDAIRDACNNDDSSSSVELPGLLPLTRRDFPSFISCSDQHSFALPTFKQQLDALEEEAMPTVLVNTFDSLESEALKAIPHYKVIGIGPLIPSAFLDGMDPSDNSFGGDLFQKSRDYVGWLDSKPKSSVVYVSFGSLLRLETKQTKEIARGLLESGRPFLWVIREREQGQEGEEEEVELEKQGKIVRWCSQLEVLSHPAVGCFVTHCGWNSTLESLVSGLPVVAFPHWTDQGTNAKLIEDVWKTGVRVKLNKEGTVVSDEVRRCIELVMDGGGGERSQELRKNAKKWKELAKEATVKGGSSHNNLKAFVFDDE